MLTIKHTLHIYSHAPLLLWQVLQRLIEARTSRSLSHHHIFCPTLNLRDHNGHFRPCREVPAGNLFIIHWSSLLQSWTERLVNTKNTWYKSCFQQTNSSHSWDRRQQGKGNHSLAYTGGQGKKKVWINGTLQDNHFPAAVIQNCLGKGCFHLYYFIRENRLPISSSSSW